MDEQNYSTPPDDRITSVPPNLECIQCGDFAEPDSKFCSESCYNEYNYTNRTCNTCGGEFWDGGTSCDCEDWETDTPFGWDEDEFQEWKDGPQLDLDDLPF